ncbi:MAG TPA: hypothetical protein VJL29_00930 [Thermoguttaceae bacterium]|nr:hypothetical protein [Thermoguttaceae bacterium]
MSIPVICPGCGARFRVSDRFAGQSGGCPKCKTTIRVPPKRGNVKVHDPQHPGRAAQKPQADLTLRPISRVNVRFALAPALGMVAATLTAFVAAWLAGPSLREYWLARAGAVLLISPPLAMAGYLLLHSDEDIVILSGRPLAIRTAICSASYAALWAVFGHVSTSAFTGEIWNWFVVAPPFVITGGLVALACYDFDFGTGCLHYSFYLLVTILLRGCAGLGWLWQLGQ